MQKAKVKERERYHAISLVYFIWDKPVNKRNSNSTQESTKGFPKTDYLTSLSKKIYSIFEVGLSASGRE